MTGADAITTALGRLVDAVEFVSFEIATLLVDGDAVAVELRLTMRSTATGRTGETEVFDLLRFRDGKIVSYKQYYDAAFATWLFTGPAGLPMTPRSAGGALRAGGTLPTSGR